MRQPYYFHALQKAHESHESSTQQRVQRLLYARGQSFKIRSSCFEIYADHSSTPQIIPKSFERMKILGWSSIYKISMRTILFFTLYFLNLLSKNLAFVPIDLLQLQLQLPLKWPNKDNLFQARCVRGQYFFFF
jgi:hypothetical protein